MVIVEGIAHQFILGVGGAEPDLLVSYNKNKICNNEYCILPKKFRPTFFVRRIDNVLFQSFLGKQGKTNHLKCYALMLRDKGLVDSEIDPNLINGIKDEPI